MPMLVSINIAHLAEIRLYVYQLDENSSLQFYENEDGELTVDNDLYTGSRPHQSEENGELYAESANFTFPYLETHHDESIYQNCEQPDEEIYANADHANQFVTDDGVVYIEVEFGAESDSNVIHGVVEDVEYAQIDLTKI
ncbi:hypothetical protein CAPTEDRAFT_204229 [Capitella teleta]|uniref:Uncharacterized protein n=1 Tax=Capitella teleta TaxID=283909 RepID=R7T4X3_CAPTE|nr:hypothetical protein CAPTEDRAFT_204229 [Capitella teleta]|eukprot:ELT87976.1 hypothetical protein CAPTEDRAFT_204229 [Capitella teleta]